MARYFFHLCDDADRLRDPDGRWLEGPDDIPHAALREARSIIGEDARSGRIRLDQRIDIEDEARNLVHRLHFLHAVEIVFPVIK